MKKFIGLSLVLIGICMAGQDYIRNGVLTGSDNACPAITSDRLFTVVDSFNPGFCDYSMGLACDGRYVWNNYAWSPRFARIDPATHAVLNIFYPTYGDRDMAFDGTYLWASHWGTNSIYKYDTSNCAIVASYDPPFSGHPNGMAWDGAYLWVGEEDGRIYKMNTTGDTIRSIPAPAPYSSNPRGLGFAAGHLWVGHQDFGNVYEIDTVTGAIISTNAAPGQVPGWNFQQGVDFGGGYLWTTTGGTYNRIYKIDIGLANIEEHKQATHGRISLGVRPNPCMNKAAINFAIEQPMIATLSVLDASGRKIATVIENQNLVSANYQYRLPEGLNESGVYFIVLRANNCTRTVKLIKL